MKSKELMDFLWNPFTRIAGWQAFGLGLVIVLATGFLGSMCGVVFDGVVDVHFHKQPLDKALGTIGISLGSLVVMMGLTGLIAGKRFRFIDLLGTLTLARAPFLLLALLGFFLSIPDLSQVLEHPELLLQNVSFYVLIILSVPVIVWSIGLTYQAFRITCDLKGRTLTIAFIIGLLVSEVLAKVLIYLIY